MDPLRAQAYLQAACAGLNFDIGEVWWTSNENGSSSLAAIETGEQVSPGSSGASSGKRFRFVQLYTSRSYESRRSELINPSPFDQEDEKSSSPDSNGNTALQHVLSPRLVDAISKTAQVVWATTKKQEGLIGRSDIRLQTAVGMPVAMDNNGNMCVVVMFSPNNVQSTDDAMEYLHSISQSATSSSIPCLLPVFDPSVISGMKQISRHPHNNHQGHQHLVPHPDPGSLGEGVSARFVSLDDSATAAGTKTLSDEPEVHSEHDVLAAPKDTFGIPMLPSFAELGQIGKVTPDDSEDAFDEATYGIWTTIMEDANSISSNEKAVLETLVGEGSVGASTSAEPTEEKAPLDSSLQISPLVVAPPPPLKESRRERLVEFCLAFLGMSVFDLADVWVPSGADGPFPSDTLQNAVTVTSDGPTIATNNPCLAQFQQVSERTLIKHWTGAVGRAFSTGNPVWSSNANSFTDRGRMGAFHQAQFRTVLAVPVFAKSATQPACVVAAYSFVKSGSVPFVLRFVQQALRLLWDGLDRIDQPHVSENVWQKVRAADLGEMAGDVEMLQHFHSKKRSHQTMMISSSEAMHLPTENDPVPAATTPTPAAATNELSTQFQSIELPNGEVITIPLHLEEPDIHSASAPPPGSAHVYVGELQHHLNDAIRSVAQAMPQETVAVKPIANSETTHVNTNTSGTKRAHVMTPSIQAAPLAPPRPLPSQIVQGHPKSGHSTPQVQAPVVNPPFSICAAISAPAPMAPSPPIVRATPAPMPPAQPMMAGLGVLPNVAATSGVLMEPPQQVPAAAAPVPPMASASAVAIASTGPSAAVQPEASLSAAFCIPVHKDGFSLGEAPSIPGKVCRIQGCNDLAVSKRPYCDKHSGNRQCEHAGCNKCAQGSTRFCIAHGGGRRCTFPGCDKGARDKFFCAAHGGGKRCQFEGCTKSAVGGSSLCTAHGGGRRCDVPGCGKSAQSSTKFCVKHGGGKKCTHEGCEKVARGRTNFCAAHGGGVRCKLDGCNRVAIGKMQLCRAHGGGSSRGGSSPPVSGSAPRVSKNTTGL